MNRVLVKEFSRLCRLAPDSEPEWESITRAHRNVLLEGPRETIEPAILLFMPYLANPIAWRRPGEALELEACRTLIVEEVGALDPAEQIRLWGRLDSARGQVQVVSTSTKALFTLVMRGLFHERLYYRLNVTLVQCRALAALSGGRTAADGRPLQTKAFH
jgi:sigma-54-interacting transcriptional regulator